MCSYFKYIKRKDNISFKLTAKGIVEAACALSQADCFVPAAAKGEEGSTGWGTGNRNLSRRQVEWGSIGWEREGVQREGPGGLVLLTAMMKLLDSSMSNVSLHAKILSFHGAKIET